MNETLDELFAELRGEAVREIRPPGVAAARRTVRRRRTAAMVGSAGAVVLAIAGGLALIGGPVGQPDQIVAASSAPSLPAAPADRAKAAQRKLTESSPSAPVIDIAAPVIDDYHREQKKHYLGNLTLRLACAGEGRITLAVESARNQFSQYEEAYRVSADCSADPVPAETPFAMTGANHAYRWRLVEWGQAAGRSGFAFQVTSDIGIPVDAADWNDRAFEPLRSLDLSGRAVKSTSSMRTGDTKPVFVEAPGLADGSYRIAMACAGTGTFTLQIRRQGRTIATAELDCRWRATQKEFEVGRVDGPVSTLMGYRSDQLGDGLVSWAWIRE